MREPSYIVYQCYGNEGIFFECAYSLLSLSRLYSANELDNVQIWIYTDKPEWFKSFKECGLPLHFRTIDAAIIKQWRGKIDFTHRVKIELLKDLCANKTGNVLYADTDTVFTHRIDKVWKDITAGQLYMHVSEGVVSQEGNPVMKKLNTFLHSSSAPQGKKKPLYDMQMWNAGVLGFHTKHKDILNEVLAFTDKVYPSFPKHIVEQFAFSVKMQEAEVVKAASPYVLHYWNLKEARQALGSFFDHFKSAAWPELVQYAALIQMHVLMQEKVNFLHNRGITAKLQKKQWSPARYNWDELTKQL